MIANFNKFKNIKREFGPNRFDCKSKDLVYLEKSR